MDDTEDRKILLRECSLQSGDVRPLCEISDLQNLIKQVETYKLDILAIQNVRWADEASNDSEKRLIREKDDIR